MGITFAEGASFVDDNGSLRFNVAVTNGVGSPYAITLGQTNGTTFTNQGATAKVYLLLPPAQAGLRYTFIVDDTDGLRFVATSGDTIRNAATVTGSGGFAESTAIGSSMVVEAINNTEWISIATQGTWSLT